MVNIMHVVIPYMTVDLTLVCAVGSFPIKSLHFVFLLN